MLEVLDFHKKMYDARWNGEQALYRSMKQLEDDFVALALAQQVDMEQINTMLGQLYIPPYKYKELPEHLKHSNSAKKEHSGRPSMGVTKKVSITLPSDIWSKIERDIEQNDTKSMSAFLREMLLNRYKEKSVDGKIN
jgi:Ribbon-helix-helix protein, copG family